MSSNQVVVTYDDKIARWFMWATLIWGIVGMAVGALIALQLAWWPANLNLPYSTFGRLRPLHTSAVVFAFGANAIFCAVYYSIQRLLKTRLFSDAISKVHFWGWQLIVVCVAVTYVLGITQGKEYAEPEWWIDILIALVWVAFSANVIGTIAIRRVKHLYVSIWFYLATLITITILHVVNNLAIPVDGTKSYVIWSGVKDALVQWWYGHNAVGFLLTTPFLGMMYYFLPKAADRPVFSYRLSIIHFWSLVFLYIWTGPHHLLYTSLPEWAQSLGMVFSLILIAPSWGGMLNGLLTLRGAWHKLRTDVVLKFFVMAITFYGMATLEGPLMSIKGLNKITHYTDYTIAHVHGGALGWVGGMIFGVIYWLAPRLFNRELYSKKMAEYHFWLATIGLLIYLVSMWTAGITQGLMWFATDDEGLLRYPQFMETVLQIKWLFWVRLFGGVLYLGGAILALINVFMTARGASDVKDEKVLVTIEPHIEPKTLHEKIENKGLLMGVLAAVLILIGGIVEFFPTFLVEASIPRIESVKPYTPLELAGRDLYVKEGCYNCHSQMIRVLEAETRRYGDYSRAGENVYDFPFQWGSKRTGPDLARQGGKYPNLWHYRHMIDPRSTTPGSIMPSYSWMADNTIDMDQVKQKLKVMVMLGVPYTDEVLNDSRQLYLNQALEIKKSLEADGVKISEESELVAMIGYLQRLGKDWAEQKRKSIGGL